MSLFDGMCCGRVAMEDLGLPIGNYYSSEIDKFAIKAATELFPSNVHLGDVTKWRGWDVDLGSVDLLFAGFPCQAWSSAGKQKGDNDPRGALVHDLIAIWKEINKQRASLGKTPVKFLFENVKMKKEFLEYINNLFGVEPVFINSALVSAQNRQRYYWTNIGEVGQPEDKGVYLADIIEAGIVDRDKSYCIDANYFRGGNPKRYFERSSRQLVFGDEWQPASIVGRRLNERGVRDDYNKDVPITQCLQVKKCNRKVGCITTVQKDNVLTKLKPGRYPDVFNKLEEDFHYRKLTVREVMRLQTVPDYIIDKLLGTDLSNNQLYKMTGNGWTVDVISHILSYLKEENTNET